MSNPPLKTTKRPVGRPPSKKGPRPNRVPVALHDSELKELKEVTGNVSGYLRDAALEKARGLLERL